MISPTRSVADMRKDCADAFNRASPYHQELREIYRYYMPFREPTVQRAPDASGPSEGQTRTDYLFDGTGLSAAANYAGQVLADWMPLGQDAFKLEAGPFMPAGVDKTKINRELAQVTDMVHALVPRVYLNLTTSMQDHFAGTSALFLTKNSDGAIVDSACAPVVELALEEGPNGEVWGVYWKRKHKMRHLEALWPKANWSDKMAKAIKEARSSTDDVTIVQYVYWHTAEKKFELVVWAETIDDADHAFYREDFRTNPWIISRQYVSPGEPFGRGLAHLGLPFVKTANRGRELALKAAVFAILGIWIRRNDAVFNPDTAAYDPGAMWTVASTGGPAGPSIARLPVPQDFDITSIVMQEEREQIRKVLLDDELPIEADAVRSATEVAGRLRRYQRNRGGLGARLPYDLIAPMVTRLSDLLYEIGALPTAVKIDHILTKLIMTAPAAAAQRAHKVESTVNWLQMVTMLLGPQAVMLTAEIESLIPELGRWLGVDERHIRTKMEASQLAELIAATVAAQQKQAAAPKQPAPSPQQAYMNGAM
jgi:hypothetical protein